MLSVVPVANPRLHRKMVILSVETPNPINLPSGCRFHPRCPLAMGACKETDPSLVELANNHQTAGLLPK